MKKKVLILEDDIFLVKVMQKKFEKNGNEVMFLLDGVKAVETAKNFQPDVILADLIMPEKDGFIAIKELKSDEQTKTIPIIVTSNLSSDEDVKRAKRLGVERYFIKSNSGLAEVIEYIATL